MKHYTLEQLSKEINVSIRILREYIKNGKLSACKVGRQYIVTETQLDAFLNDSIYIIGESDETRENK